MIRPWVFATRSATCIGSLGDEDAGGCDADERYEFVGLVGWDDVSDDRCAEAVRQNAAEEFIPMTFERKATLSIECFAYTTTGGARISTAPIATLDVADCLGALPDVSHSPLAGRYVAVPCSANPDYSVSSTRSGSDESCGPGIRQVLVFDIDGELPAGMSPLVAGMSPLVAGAVSQAVAERDFYFRICLDPY